MITSGFCDVLRGLCGWWNSVNSSLDSVRTIRVALPSGLKSSPNTCGCSGSSGSSVASSPSAVLCASSWSSVRDICTHNKHARADPLRDFPSLLSTALFYCPYGSEDDQPVSIRHKNATIIVFYPEGHRMQRSTSVLVGKRSASVVVKWNPITTQQRTARRPAPFSPHSLFRLSQYGLWCVSLWRISAIPVNKWTGEMPAIAWALAGTMLAVRPHDGYSLMIHLMPFGSRLQSLGGFTSRYWSKKTSRQETERLRTILNLVPGPKLKFVEPSAVWPSLCFFYITMWGFSKSKAVLLSFSSSSPRMMEWFL